MIAIDEVALIEFFGVAPEPQPEAEREFFAALSFKKRVAGLEIHIAISAHFQDLHITLYPVHCDAPILDLAIPGITAVTIDRSSRRAWLRCTSQCHGAVEIAVEPTITVTSNHIVV